jgi:predicted acyl esterase
MIGAAAIFVLSLAAAAAQAQTLRVPSEPGVVLAATLRTPSGPGPFPVVLLLSGSGPSKRGVFALLAERLLARGIATFEYDKRGVGESTGSFVDTIVLNQKDGEAALAWLRARPGIDGRRIAVLGMSQGGVVAPALAASDPGIAAVVMLAGPVGRRSQPFMTGLHARLAQAGHGEEVIEPIAQAVRQWMEARARAAGPGEIDRLRGAAVEAFGATGATPEQAEGMVAVLDTSQLLSMYEAGPYEDLARIGAPVLALFAEKDEVLSAASMPAARAALAPLDMLLRCAGSSNADRACS